MTDGFAVYAAENQVFRKSFGPYTEGIYPDFGCNFETYTNRLFLECELVGELREFLPGESAEIEETWEIRETMRTPDEVIAELIAQQRKN